MPRPKKVRPEFPKNFNVFDDSVSDDFLAYQVLAVLLPRELDVYALLIRGILSKNIADDLKLAKRTIDYHRYKIKQKLRLKNVAEEVVLGYRIRHALTDWQIQRGFQAMCGNKQRVVANAAKPIDTVDNSVE